ncbi:MAG: response regulator transcription factor [Porticoccaceae bacterium]|jgi:DNA-binding response OmpR family regulator|nr:response regulator transcription factor [Porticoccaceae bacterium]MEA3300808.1 response regulator transcription factor [Pseudomonadota bacterium]HLS99235.1 response regulator transcription factor [Porticoccaceae bacterium]
MHILLIEDDGALAESLGKALAAKGHVVNPVGRGQLGLNALKTDAPDIIILDLGLPDMDGFTVLKRIRETDKALPVLLLTARDTLDDKVAGLDGGADDYLTKPFDMAELFARLRVLERRLSTTRTNEIRIGEVVLDTARTEVTRDGTPLDLSRREYMLLKVLMENAGKVLTRASLESRLYSWGEEVASNTVEVHVHHLRKKLGADFIHTVRGVGYRVDAP